MAIKILSRVLLTLAAITGVTAATSASAGGDYRFRHPPNRLSRQFRDGTCIYKIIYGNYGNTPYATVHLYSQSCFTPKGGHPRAYVQYQPGSGTTISRGALPRIDACGVYTGYQATGPAGRIATNMWVHFPVTGNWKRFGSSGLTPVPATSCP